MASQREAYIDEERRPESSSKELLDLPDHLLEFIMLKEDARSQVVSGTLCRAMRDIWRDPLYHAQRERLPPPATEPVYAAVYLPTMTAYPGAYPQAWDPAAGAWRALPPLDFLPPGQIVPAHRGVGGYGAQGGAAPGLLFFHHLDVQAGYLAGPVRVRLCVCNPVTRTAVFLEPPPRIPRGAADAGVRGLEAAQAHLLLRVHAAPAAGFTVYDFGRMPRALRRLRVVPPPAPAAAVRGRRTLVASAAQWTTVDRRRARHAGQAAGNDGLLMVYAKPVLVEQLGVIRTLCLREVAAGRRGGQYQALFIDYNVGTDQWADHEHAVGGVPLHAGARPQYDDVSLVCLGGDAGGLWLLHSPPGLTMVHPPAAADPEDPDNTGGDLKALDIYVYRPEAGAFDQVDRGSVPESAFVAHGAAATGSNSTTICLCAKSSRAALTYDVVTRTWARGSPVPRIVPTSRSRSGMDYSEWPVANFQLSHARFI